MLSETDHLFTWFSHHAFMIIVHAKKILPTIASLALRPKSLVWSRVMVPPLVSTRTEAIIGPNSRPLADVRMAYFTLIEGQTAYARTINPDFSGAPWAIGG
jgi:hypothetical protein